MPHGSLGHIEINDHHHRALTGMKKKKITLHVSVYMCVHTRVLVYIHVWFMKMLYVQNAHFLNTVLVLHGE